MLESRECLLPEVERGGGRKRLGRIENPNRKLPVKPSLSYFGGVSLDPGERVSPEKPIDKNLLHATT